MMIIRLYYHKIELIKESCNFRSCFTANCHRLYCTFINFELVQILMRVDESFGHARGNIQSTLMQLLFSFDRGRRVEKILMQTLASQLSSTLMQLLFSFDQGMRVEKTLMHTLASQLSCNSCSRLTGE